MGKMRFLVSKWLEVKNHKKNNYNPFTKVVKTLRGTMAHKVSRKDLLTGNWGSLGCPWNSTSSGDKTGPLPMVRWGEFELVVPMGFLHQPSLGVVSVIIPSPVHTM